MINYNKIKLFGEQFVNNNKKNCFLVINDKFIKLKAYIDLKEIFGDDYSPEIYPIKIKVKLIERNNQKITNLSSIFYGICSLDSSSNLCKFNTINITKMNNMFDNCKSLLKLPDISEWDTTNVIDMSYMFNNCKLLSTLPDISQWNTSNLVDASFLFNNCESLISIPDISKWNTSSLNNMSFMFKNCKNLGSLPEISKWKTDKVKNMSHLFYKCSSLNSLPEISKWKTNNINDISYMFSGCTLLLTVPDISKWNIKNNVNISHLFSYCTKLNHKPDISKWKKVDINEIDIFEGTNLISVQLDFDKDKNTMNAKKIIFDYLKTIFIFFCNGIYFIFIVIIIIIIAIIAIIIALFLVSLPLFLIYFYLNLNKGKSFIDSPLDYIDLTNLTNMINHTNYINITNNTDIKSLIDFTEINGNNTFQSDEYKILFLDILLLILYIVNFILIIIYTKNGHTKNIKSNLIIIFLNIFIMIVDILDFIIFIRLDNSFNSFFDKLETILEIKISLEERIKIINLSEDIAICIFILIISFTYCIINFISFNNNIIEEKASKTKNKFYIIINELLKKMNED